VKRVLIDPGSSADILYSDAFEKMGLDEEQLQPFKRSLAGFIGERVHVRGYITLKTTFGDDLQAKTVQVRYHVVSSPHSYNIIIGRPTFNLLGAFLFIKYLVMKYLLDNGTTGRLGETKRPPENVTTIVSAFGKRRRHQLVKIIQSTWWI
jgi:hypothetical protein